MTTVVDGFDDFVQLEEDNPIFLDDQDELGPEFATIEEWQRHHLRNILELSLFVQKAPEKKPTQQLTTNDESNGLTAGVPDPSLHYPHLASAAVAGSCSEDLKASDVEILELASAPTPTKAEAITLAPEIKIEIIDYTKSPLVPLDEDDDESFIIAMEEMNLPQTSTLQTEAPEAPRRKSILKTNKLKHSRSISWGDSSGTKNLMEVYEVPYYLESRWHRFKRRHRLTMIISTTALILSLLALMLALYQFLR